ncbi:MAG TPA: aminotransferase class IV [Puia sp.]|jgi:branched-chain amino acid aminotransferase|nr:aminotransferase class IV [Puia sp.]
MFLNFNGEVREETIALLRADNRGFRFGDGLFETMLLKQGKVRLGQYHFERLVAGMQLLRLEFPQAVSLEMMERQIGELCARNGIGGLCRARLTVFRRGGGMYNGLDRRADYCIEVSALGVHGSAPGAQGSAVGAQEGALAGAEWVEDGLVLDVFPDGRKSCDIFSGVKSNNYLLSTQAGMFARERGVDDCVLVNSHGRVAETTVANIWWVKNGVIYTPPLSEGCVAGVMRRWLLERLPGAGYSVREEPIGPDELIGAGEIFITNAIRGVRWVREFRGAQFGCRLAAAIGKDIVGKI